MATTFQLGSTRLHTNRSIALAAAVVGIGMVLVIGTVLLVVARPTQAQPEAAGSGLSPQQIVTRGEVADRVQQAAGSGLSPQQIVTRGEVADRVQQAAGSGH